MRAYVRERDQGLRHKEHSILLEWSALTLRPILASTTLACFWHGRCRA